MKITKSVMSLTLGLGLIAGLGACSGDVKANDAKTTSAAAETSKSADVPATSAEAAPTSEAAPSSEAPAAAPAGAKTSAELDKTLGKVKNKAGQALALTPTADLEQGVKLAKSLAGTMKVSPADCQSSVNSSMSQVDGAAMAGGTFTDGVVVALTSMDSAAIKKLWSDGETARSKCKEFTINIAGQQAKASQEVVDASTKADSTVGIVQSQTSAAGETKSAIIQAVKGNVSITVQKSGAGVSAADVPELAAIVDQVVAALS